MADSRSYTKSSPFSPQQVKNTDSISTQKTSYAQIFCKSILFLIFLVAIPLFPSQAPNFINQSLLTKFWELVHLLFIGVAVSYGLFSRRNVEVDFETQVNNNTFDDSQSSYVSRIFHVSPIFDDGSENQYGFDEKNVYPSYYYQSWNNSQLYRGESTVGESTVNSGMVNSSSSVMIDESSKIGSLNSDENQTTQIENDENSNVVQAWSSQYYQGESMVVLSEANYAIDDWGRHEQVVGRYRPLELPVRSLRSRIRKVECSQFSNINGNDLDSKLIGGVSGNENYFGNMGPMKLEEKFDENPSSIPPQVSWQQQSRSGRTEMWENLGPFSNFPSHFRPLSVDETQFESLQPHSFRSATSFSSQASSVSDSPAVHSPSHYTSSSDSPNSRGGEESGKEREFRASYPPAASQSPQATLNREVRLNAFHLRRYSSGSLFQKDLRKTLKDELKDLSGKRKEDPSSSSLSRKQKAQGLLKSDTQAATVVKASSRGKSVRSIRGGVYKAEAMKDAEINGTHIDEQVGEGSKEAKARNIEKKNEMKVEIELQKEVGGLDKKKKKKKNFDDRWKFELQKEGGHDNMPTREASKEAKVRNIEKKNEMEGEVELQKEVGGLDKMKKKNLDDRWKLELQKEGGNDNMPISINRKNVETQEDQDAPNKTYPKYQNQEKNEFFEKVTVETTDESEGEADSDKEDATTVTPAASACNAGNDDPNEVDKKAGEFIAKFREQIRLQKVASIERSKGTPMSGKHFRR